MQYCHFLLQKNRTVLHYAAIGGFRNLTERIFSEIVNIEVLLFTRDTVGIIIVIKISVQK